MSLPSRFMKFVKKSRGCWAWTGGTDRTGRGRFWWKGKLVNAPRLAYEFAFFNPGDKLVCHTCDNPNCVRPSHLFLGTVKDNVQDMIQKGRKARTHTSSKLSPKSVAQIRRACAAGAFQKDVAADYGVTQSAVSRIVTGDIWSFA